MTDEPVVLKRWSPSWIFQKIRSELRYVRGSTLNRLGMPGFISPIEIDDWHTGKVKISNSAYYTRIHINGRDFYFNRESGKFDGTGICIGGSCDA